MIHIDKSYKDIITVVSGLPRSGTSMMMKMLEAGGIPVLQDHIRTPDIDNPKGYYEFERVKQIKTDQTWLDDATGKVVKMVSMLLLDLPPDRLYKIVFMRREMKEVLVSQRKMLERLGKQEKVTPEQAAIEDRRMDYNYRQHLIKVHNFMTRSQNIDLLYVKYNDFLADPAPHVASVAEFFNGELDAGKMAEVVDPALYRNRG